VASAANRFNGPISYFGKRPADAQWQYINDIQLVAADPTWNGAQFAYCAEDMGRPHLISIVFESNTNISYDVEVVRHFEVIPGEECPLEVRECALDMQFANPIDILRKMDIRHVMQNPFAPA